MERRNVQFWVQLYPFPNGDRLIREEDYYFFGNEEAFAEFVDAELSKWIKKHKDFGIKEYGWKYITTSE